MRNILITAVILLFASCDNKYTLTNETKPTGYAKGESVRMRFSLTAAKEAPDSIDVSVLEKKTGYLYEFRAGLDKCDSLCRYSADWDGRKPDGRWPAGGVYLVSAAAGLERTVHSDTVEIGLSD